MSMQEAAASVSEGSSCSPGNWDSLSVETVLLEVRKLGLSIQRDCRDEIRSVGRQLADDVRLEFRMMMQELPRSLASSLQPEGVCRQTSPTSCSSEGAACQGSRMTCSGPSREGGRDSPPPLVSRKTCPGPSREGRDSSVSLMPRAPSLESHFESPPPLLSAEVVPFQDTAPPSNEEPQPPASPPPALLKAQNSRPRSPQTTSSPSASRGSRLIPATESTSAADTCQVADAEGQTELADQQPKRRSFLYTPGEDEPVEFVPNQVADPDVSAGANQADWAAGGAASKRKTSRVSICVQEPKQATVLGRADSSSSVFSDDSSPSPKKSEGLTANRCTSFEAFEPDRDRSDTSFATSRPLRKSCTAPQDNNWDRISVKSQSQQWETASEPGDISHHDRLSDLMEWDPDVTSTAKLAGEFKRMRISISREVARAAAKRKKNGMSTLSPIVPTDGSEGSGTKQYKNRLEGFVKSQFFDNMVSFIILVNAMVLGAQIDYNVKEQSRIVPHAFFVFEQIFLVLFTTELVLRVAVYRGKFFIPFRDGWQWNYFDALVVSAQLVEMFLEFVARASQFKSDKLRLLRVMRILRILRILRVVRVLHLISELRTILSSIAGSFRSLIWVVVLLFLMIYIVACYFTQSFADHMTSRRESEYWVGRNDGEVELEIYFGSLSRSVLSLWQSISGGVDWNVLVHPLLGEVGLHSGLLFSAFLAFSILALMNVVTGVFVQNALNSAKQEEENFITSRILELFHFAERKEGANIRFDEIEASISDPKTAREWASIGVEAEDARHLFKLFDMNEEGLVPFDEFLGGCLRLGGSAKALDVLTIMQENRKYQEQLHIFQQESMAMLVDISQKISRSSSSSRKSRVTRENTGVSTSSGRVSGITLSGEEASTRSRWSEYTTGTHADEADSTASVNRQWQAMPVYTTSRDMRRVSRRVSH